MRRAWYRDGCRDLPRSPPRHRPRLAYFALALLAALLPLPLPAEQWPGSVRDGASSAPVVAGVTLQFPRDFGSHPQFGIEWWYVTGWLTTAQHQPLGFQITFFRVRPSIQSTNPSDFTAHQLLIAHCALADPAHGRLWQEQRIRRAGLNLVGAAVGDTDVRMDDWRLQRHAGVLGDDSSDSTGSYQASIAGSDFALQLSFTASSAPMLNGNGGFSQKGPEPRSASYYYSVPQLRVAGRVVRAGRAVTVTGEAWLDHEWASEYLDPAAEGWDWVGLNLADGGALMAFEIRDRQGRDYWGGGTLRDAHGRVQILSASQVRFTPLSRWRSPRSGVSYPVVELVRAGPQHLLLEPLMDDQEFDARQSSGAYYWEGAVRARAPSAPASTTAGTTASASATASVGRGYLELTGYDRPLSLR